MAAASASIHLSFGRYIIGFDRSFFVLFLFLLFGNLYCENQSRPARESRSNSTFSPSESIKLPKNVMECPSFHSKMSLHAKGAGCSSGSKVDENDGIIIVDHGSSVAEANLMLNDFVNMFRNRTGYRIVEPAHMELAEPSISDAFNACVLNGATRVIVSPYFLSYGKHLKQDIPSLTAKAAEGHPGVQYIITAPLGLHPLLVDVVQDRINQCLSHHMDGNTDMLEIGDGNCLGQHA